MKLLFLLLLSISCQSTEPTLLIGECFSGGSWHNEKTQEKSNFGDTVYLKLIQADRNYLFNVYDRKTNKRFGGFAQPFSAEHVLEKIKCPSFDV